MTRNLGIMILATLSLWLTGCDKAYEAQPMDAPAITASQSTEWVDAINAARDAGCVTTDGNLSKVEDSNLTWNDTLYRVAYEHAYDMNASGKNPPNGKGSGGPSDHTAQVQHLGHASTLDDRLKNNEYAKTYLQEIATRAGNLETLDGVIKKWTSDPKTCEQLMDGRMTEFGLAHIQDNNASEYKNFWVIDLGKPAAGDTWL